MTPLNYVCIGGAVTTLFFAGAVILIYRNNVRKTMKTIDHMVETAISGEFSERFFDESVMSAVEAKLAQFLSICSVFRKICWQKQIK
ncbi:hypothetical protein [Paenibacillus polymyxa]|uniref:hypothetical protein n=1 Tax=Paenibacillus polymyxa TaxID=1406 RepID=UPI000497F8FF|nr:hypothetical protein [Paenibacillus polymyxa]